MCTLSIVRFLAGLALSKAARTIRLTLFINIKNYLINCLPNMSKGLHLMNTFKHLHQLFSHTFYLPHLE